MLKSLAIKPVMSFYHFNNENITPNIQNITLASVLITFNQLG